MTLDEFQQKLALFEVKVTEIERLKKDLQDFNASIDKRIQRNEINSKKIIDEYLSKRKSELQEQIKAFDIQKSESEKQLTDIAERIEKDRKFFELKQLQDREAIKKIFKEKTLGFPWLAKAYGDYLDLRDKQIGDYLENKRPPALKGAEAVKLLRKEKNKLEKEYRVSKYLLQYYENLFPWLLDFRGEELDDIIKRILEPDGREESIRDNDDPARIWLTDAEYKNLSSVEKYQLALDRYWEKKKSSWEIGRDYERYIGYLYESEGFEVYYQGIVKGFEDLGRDLICTKGNNVEIVQCKCWSKNKTIHEKHINQLFGTTVMYWIQKVKDKSVQFDLFPSSIRAAQIMPCFITSTELSDSARQFASALGVKIKEKFPFVPYPSIKCNVSRTTGEKIYHLPFDQQYDKTLIEEERSECYVETVAKAESLGFRRAFQWRGDKTMQ
ncbi:MAG: restriction endonuclease [Candidatus Schekmanbacteria bacterium]|nr:restriction endonuclease [Candidatus Schekmanbacteria bacterium]